MNIYYLDASAWVKRYVLERGTPEVQALFNAQSRFACSTLGIIEVIATLSRKCKFGDLSFQELKQKEKEIESDWLHFIKIYQDDFVTENAITVAQNYFLRGADAVHVASAILLKTLLPNPSDQITIVSSDDELNETAINLGFSVLNPLIGKSK